MPEARKKQPGHPEPAVAATRSIAGWMDYLTLERGRSPGTVRVYMGDLNDFARFLSKSCTDERVVRAARDDIRRYIRTLTGIRKMEPASVRRAIASLRSFYRYAVYTARRRDNPAEEIELPKLGGRQPKALTEDQVWAILSARVHADDEELHQRDRAIFETMYASGVRIAELCNINLADVDRERQWIRIPKGKGNKARFAMINASALQAINAYLAIRRDTPSNALFVSKAGNRLTTRAVHHAFTARVRAAGLDKQQERAPMTPHSLRHSFARHLLEHGADLPEVQELLGHANITSTQIYITPELTKLKSAYQQAHPRDRFEYSQNLPRRRK
jgi:site-specific recombinase XerD